MRILLAEDDPSIAEGICASLRHGTHAVDHVASGQLADAALRDHDYDLLVLDWMLPRRDGLQVLKALRGSGSCARVLMLSARDTVADRVAALDAGADDYLGKPFDSRELLARVRANLRRQAPIEELVVLRYGDLVYDTKALLLACGREEIAVSKKLGLMIELFMKSKGQALARATLFARVWGADADVEEAILDNYIGFFRRRLAQIHSKMSLRTVRGVGYALVEEKEGR